MFADWTTICNCHKNGHSKMRIGCRTSSSCYSQGCSCCAPPRRSTGAPCWPTWSPTLPNPSQTSGACSPLRYATPSSVCLYYDLILIGLLYKAHPDGCQHRLQILLRPRPYPIRGHWLLHLKCLSVCLSLFVCGLVCDPSGIGRYTLHTSLSVSATYCSIRSASLLLQVNVCSDCLLVCLSVCEYAALTPVYTAGLQLLP